MMRVVPALHGWHWLRDGLKLFASAPLTWMLLVLSYWLVIALVGVLPLIGAFIGVVLMPAFGASFMNIGRTAERGTIATPLLLFSGLRTRQIDMLLLGGVYLVACILVLSTTSLVDGGEFAQFLVAGRAPTTRDLNGPLVAALAYTPVMLAFWFAPALVMWHNMSAAKGLFYSFFAAWRNWRAMFVYGVVTGLVFAIGAWILVLLLQSFLPDMLAAAGASGGASPGRGAASLVVFILLPAVFACVAILLASFYASYRDVFAD